MTSPPSGSGWSTAWREALRGMPTEELTLIAKWIREELRARRDLEDHAGVPP